jgi:hypothetical protein
MDGEITMFKLIAASLVLAVTLHASSFSGGGGGGSVTDSSTTTFTNKSIDADDNTITDIDNNEIKAAAAIAVNKLAALTASEAVVSDGSGFLASATGVSATELGYVNGVTSAIQTQMDAKLPTTGVGLVEQICGHIETPSNKTYWPIVKSKVAYTINEITTDVDSGTISMELQIDGVAVTGCAAAQIAVTSTESDDTCTAANALSVGNDLTIVTTSNSSADDLRFCIKVTRS